MADDKLIQVEPLVQQLQSAIPKMMKGRDAAVKALSAITEINSDDDRTETMEMVGAGKNTIDDIQALRMPITKQTDELKRRLMEPEKEIQEHVDRLRGLIGKYDQGKIDEKAKKEKEARDQRIKEDYKVTIASQIRENISKLITIRMREVNDGVKKFFSEITLENFEDKAKLFMTYKAVLKTETYEKCFHILYDKAILTPEEFSEVQKKVSEEEPFSAWSEKVIAEITPILSDKKASLPALKEELIALANAKDEKEKERLEQERQRKAKEEEDRAQAEIKAKEAEAQQQIADRESVDKMHNTFVEQIANQENGDTGPTKLIGRFKDQKPTKALCEVILHCLSHPKFKGVQKRNKEGMLLVDDHDFPEYIDGVQPWINFFLTNCKDKKVEGFETKEVAKVIVRK